MASAAPEVSDSERTYLDRLAMALKDRGLPARVVGEEGSRPFVRTVNPEVTTLAEQVSCVRADERAWRYVTGWGYAVGDSLDVARAAERLAFILGVPR